MWCLGSLGGVGGPEGSRAGVRILPGQTEGLESLGVIPEVLDHDDLALAKRLDVRDVDACVRATTDARPPGPRDHPVTSVDQADRLHLTGVPRVAQLLEEPEDRFSPKMRSGLWPFFDGPHDDVWIVGLPEPFDVPCGPRLDTGPHDLYVLLRT